MGFVFEFEDNNPNYATALNDSFECLFESPADNEKRCILLTLDSLKQAAKKARKEEQRKSPNKFETKGQSQIKKAAPATKADLQDSPDGDIDKFASILEVFNEDLSKRRSLEELSDKNSVFVDLSNMVSQLEDIPVGKELDSFVTNPYENAMAAMMGDLGHYPGMVSTILNRTVVHLDDFKNLKLDDELLLNASTLFTKLPQWSLSIDLGDILPKDDTGERYTGVTIYRTPVYRTASPNGNNKKKKGPNKAPVKAQAPQNEILFNGLTLTVETNRSAISTMDLVFEIKDEESIALMLRRALGPQIAKSVDDTSLEDLGLDPNEEYDELPQDFVDAIERLFKAITFVLTRMHLFVDKDGKSLALKNNTEHFPLDFAKLKKLATTSTAFQDVYIKQD